MSPTDRGSRLAGGGAVILVHVLLIAFILSGLPKSAPVPRTVREIVLMLMPKPKPVEIEPRQKTSPRRTVISPPVRYPYSAPAIAPQIAPAPKALRVPLFRCAPETLGKLSPEDQAKCDGYGFAPPDHGTIAALRSHVREPALRAAELAARKTPAKVDCAQVKYRVIQNMAQDTGIFVDPVCAAAKLGHALRR